MVYQKKQILIKAGICITKFVLILIKIEHSF